MAPETVHSHQVGSPNTMHNHSHCACSLYLPLNPFTHKNPPPLTPPPIISHLASCTLPWLISSPMSTTTTTVTVSSTCLLAGLHGLLGSACYCLLLPAGQAARPPRERLLLHAGRVCLLLLHAHSCLPATAACTFMSACYCCMLIHVCLLLLRAHSCLAATVACSFMHERYCLLPLSKHPLLLPLPDATASGHHRL